MIQLCMQCCFLAEVFSRAELEFPLATWLCTFTSLSTGMKQREKMVLHHRLEYTHAESCIHPAYYSDKEFNYWPFTVSGSSSPSPLLAVSEEKEMREQECQNVNGKHLLSVVISPFNSSDALSTL